jgi:hypothetical protein
LRLGGIIEPVKVRLRVLAAVGILLGLLAVSGAPAAQQRQVRLTVSITGNGAVRLTDGRRLSCSTSRCHKTFAVQTGVALKLTARPGSGWALSAWSGACQGPKPTCGLRLHHATGVTATFRPPGSTNANPIPLGHRAAIGDGWVLSVTSATLDATAQIVAIPGNSPPHPGAQYTLLNLAATYTGGGSSILDDFGDKLSTVGAHNATYYGGCGQVPPPALPVYQSIFSGQSISGNICYEIASNDAPSLELRAYASFSGGYVWFALR